MALSITEFTISVVAALLCIFIAAETVIVVFVPFNLTESGPYTGLQRAAYATVSTVVASAITTFVTARIRRLWIADVDRRFHHDFGNSVFDYNQIQGRWRTALSVSSISETLRFWRVQFTFLAVALITTSIVASLTPTLATRSIVSNANVSTGLPWRCAMIQNASDTDYSVYEWQLSNGSYLAAGGNWPACPSRWAVTLMGGINFINASTYAYSDLGVAVKSTAIGAPVSIFGLDPVTGIGRTFTDFLGVYGSNVVATTQCVRVMVSNPISCHMGGTVHYTSGTTSPIIVNSDDGVCAVKSVYDSDPETSSYLVKGICATGQPGQATIVLGATGAYARWLAVAINYADRPFEDGDVPAGYTFAVTCNMDARTVFAYRKVTLSLQDAKQIQQTSLGRQLNGGDKDCRTFDPDQNLGVMGAAVSANWQPLSQNDGIGGWFDSINQMTIDFSGRQSRLPPYAFPESQNALEDTLGLVAGLAVARLNGTMENITSTATITHTRVGSGRQVGLFYALPPVTATVILCVLLARAWPPDEGDFSSINLENLSRVDYRGNYIRPRSDGRHCDGRWKPEEQMLM